MSKSKKELIFETAVSTVWKMDNGVYIYKLKNTNTPFDKNEVKLQLEKFHSLTGGKNFSVLVDARDSLNLPTDDANLFFKNNNPKKSKIAILTNNLPMNLFLSQILKYDKVMNAKMFRNKEKAIAWLTSEL